MRLDDFKLEVYFDRHEFNARHLMAQSDCQAMTVASLLALEPGAESQLHDTWLGYTEVAGDAELRGLVAAQYRGLAAEDVLMHSGAEEAIFAYMNVTLQPGDRVICMVPTYQSLFGLAQAIGAHAVPWRLTCVEGGSGGRWKADFDELAELITPETRLIVINTPNNPTGFTLTAAQIDRLVELASTYDISIFSDEVYRGLTVDGLTRPALAEVYDRAVTLGVLSKAYGLAGLRAGWLIGKDHGLLSRVQRYKHYLSICNPSVTETLAKIALRHGSELIAANLEIIRDNIELAEGFFARHTELFVNNPPQCGSVAFHRLKEEEQWNMSNGGKLTAERDRQYVLNTAASAKDADYQRTIGNAIPTIEVFCEKLVHEAGVLLLPGSLFEHPGDYFRMGYGRRDFSEGLAALEHYLTL